MKKRTTQILLGVIILLLVPHLLNASSWFIAAAQQHTEDVVRARTFELVDARGMVRARLESEAGGGVIFRMRDTEGRIRVKLGADSDGSGLVLLDGRTEPGIHLLSKQSGTAITVTAENKEKLILQP